MLVIFIIILNGCGEEAAPKKAVKAAQPPVFDVSIAHDKAIKRFVNIDMDGSPLPTGSDYIRLVVENELPHADPKTFLSGLTSHLSQMVVILAHIQNGETLKLPPIPLFIFEKQDKDWITSFQAKGALSPLFVAQRDALSLSIEIILLNSQLDGLSKDAEKVIHNYTNTLPLYSKERAHEISTLSDGFSNRIALVEEASLKNVAQFNVSYLESYANKLNLLSKSGDIELTSVFSVTGQKTVLPLHQGKPPLYDSLLTHKIGEESPRNALGDLEAGFWSVPVDVLHPTCQAVRGALIERLGLSTQDSAIILWRMMQPHAMFAQNIDYSAQCSGEDIAALLSDKNLTLPQLKQGRASSKSQNAMNKTLSTIASLIKNTHSKNEQKMSTLMAENILIRDQARLLFSDETNQVIETINDVIAPTVSKEFAAQYLMTLPIKAYGCYSKGKGQTENHRASLVTFENDSALWMLDFAFNDNNKIKGLNLRTVTQKDFCRAIGARKGKNRCTFSDKEFSGLTPAKCG